MNTENDRPKTILKRRKIKIYEEQSTEYRLKRFPGILKIPPAESIRNGRSGFKIDSATNPTTTEGPLETAICRYSLPHVRAPMYTLHVRERVLFYLIYRLNLGRRKTFMKPDYAELAKHLQCHNSAVYKAINDWLELGIIEATKTKGGIKSFALDDEASLWLSIFPAGKNIIRGGKKSSRDGIKNSVGKNNIDEIAWESSEDEALPTSAENPKYIIKNIQYGDKMGPSSTLTFGRRRGVLAPLPRPGSRSPSRGCSRGLTLPFARAEPRPVHNPAFSGRPPR